MATPGQFVEQAMLSGYEQGSAKRDSKKDEELQQKITDLLNQRDALQQKYSTVKNTPDEAQVKQDILSNQSAIREFYHPDKNPGAIAKYGRLLMERMHMVKPLTAPTITTPQSLSTAPLPKTPAPALAAEPGYTQVTATPPGTPGSRFQVTRQPGVAAAILPPVDTAGLSNITDTMAVAKPTGLIAPGNLPIWNRPTVQNADGTHSSEYSVSFGDQNGHEVLVPTVVNGKFLTPDGKKPAPGSKEEKQMFARAWKHYLDTGENLGVFDNPHNADAYAEQLHNRGQRPGVVPSGNNVTVKGPTMTDKQRAQALKNQSADEKAAKALEASAPFSPEQNALQRITAQLQAIDQSDLSPEDKEEARQAVYKIAPKPKWAMYDVPGGGTQYFDASRPDLLPEGATLHVPTTAAQLTAQGYMDYRQGGGTDAYPLWLSKQKQSSAALQQWVMATYGKSLWELSPEDASAAVSRYKQLTTPSTVSSGQTLIFDLDGNPHLFTHTTTNTKTFPNAQPTPGSHQSAVPAGGTSGGSPAQPRSPSSPRSPIGPPIAGFVKATPEAVTALKNRDTAYNSYLDVQNAERDRTPVGDTGVILAWLRGRVNRVTATEISAVNNLGGAQMKLEGNYVRLVSGKMTDQQRDWFLQSAKNNYDDAVKVANQYTNPQGPQNQTGDFWSQMPDHQPAGAH